MRILRSGSVVDSPDTGAMRTASFRARLLRVVLAVSALALLALAAASARGLDTGTANGLPRSNGVAVLDLSLSIGEDDYRDIRNTLGRLIASDGSLGLVIFSDVPYELLPPGSPAAELRPMLRLLVPPEQRPGRPRSVSPWAQSFSAGTRISTALEFARDVIVRDGVQNGTILLLSDLVTAPEDVPQLARTLQELRRDGIDIKVVPLTPLKDGLTIFEGLLGKSAFIAPSRAAGTDALPTDAPSRLPVALLVLGALVLVVLAAHERFAGRLGLPRSEGSAA